MTGWRRTFEGYFGDLDALLPYKSSRTVKIRDCRLGLALLILQLGILGYVVGYQLAYNQQYQVQGDVIASSRMQLQRPEAAYRWPDGAAPYCTNGTGAGSSAYRVDPATGTYEYIAGPGGVPFPQSRCLMLDELYAVPQSIERDAVMLTTRLTTSQEQAVPQPDCAGLAHEYCSWVTVGNSTDYYVADPEFFTLLVDHSMYAPDAGITRTVRQMKGRMRVRQTEDPNAAQVQSKEDRDQNAPTINPCDAYTSSGLSCPSYVNVGQVGDADIFPIKTLLQAAGISSLDMASGYNDTETFRHAGILLVLEVEYSNYFRDTGSWRSSDVAYTYWVTAVPGSEYKAEEAVTYGANATNPAPDTRTVYNRHGVRIVLSFSGRIGSFNVQAFLINLFVSLGLLGAANALMEAVVFYLPLPVGLPGAGMDDGHTGSPSLLRSALSCCGCCSSWRAFVAMRGVYRQYKERETVDFGDLLRSRKADRAAVEALLMRFDHEPGMVDPVPEVFRALLPQGGAFGIASQSSGRFGKAGTDSVSSTPVVGPEKSVSGSPALTPGPTVVVVPSATSTAINPLASSGASAISSSSGKTQGGTVDGALLPVAGTAHSDTAVAEWRLAQRKNASK